MNCFPSHHLPASSQHQKLFDQIKKNFREQHAASSECPIPPIVRTGNCSVHFSLSLCRFFEVTRIYESIMRRRRWMRRGSIFFLAVNFFAWPTLFVYLLHTCRLAASLPQILQAQPAAFVLGLTFLPCCSWCTRVCVAKKANILLVRVNVFFSILL